MTMQHNNADTDQKTLSEKARRLLAAHDREVSEFRREQTVSSEGYALKMAG